jgi:cob(I)alamin adenosyltransferase
MMSQRLLGVAGRLSRGRGLASKKFKPVQGSGDSGESSLYSGQREWKDAGVFEALGTVDELSSHLGLARQQLDQSGLFQASAQLRRVQCVLQDIGSHLATPEKGASEGRLRRTEVPLTLPKELEEACDELTESLPPLTSFILPGGSASSAQLHVARSVCRRAERRVASLLRQETLRSPVPLQFLNRLSDLLFLLARQAAQADGAPELSYEKP